ncbi:hypothetical protein BDW02DRAFT_95943 [Decorospora gaudefroyi]|uniref:Uncharacterized protein n=1 Tax=Decorospora gaudefroyi TaxID=184978 RepID=A0A6A5KPY0_9PLEO|nr:hypothetical protein BDW02DRAFT_95943 [Decorospora gaudefroyi]
MLCYVAVFCPGSWVVFRHVGSRRAVMFAAPHRYSFASRMTLSSRTPIEDAMSIPRVSRVRDWTHVPSARGDERVRSCCVNLFCLRCSFSYSYYRYLFFPFVSKKHMDCKCVRWLFRAFASRANDKPLKQTRNSSRLALLETAGLCRLHIKELSRLV